MKICRLVPGAAAAATLALALLSSGCGILDPRSDPSRFFLLATIGPQADAPAFAVPPGTTFGIGPIEVFEYLNRPEIIVQISATEIRRDTYLRWAELPDSMVPRVLGEDLALLLGPERMVRFPWYAGHEPTYQFRASIARMDRKGDAARLVVMWRIVEVKTDKLVWARYSESSKPLTSEDTNELVQALSDQLGDVSREMVAAMRSVLEKGPQGGGGR